MKKTVIVGAGPAGLMAAGALQSPDVLLLEQNEKAGKKLYITGKGRCNVTHECDSRTFLDGVVTNARFLYSCMHAFSPSDTRALLQQYGTPTKVERGNRVFPVSDKASDVTKALQKYALSSGAQMQNNTRVFSVLPSDDGFLLKTDKGDIACGKLILACGGASYPMTGSDGSGYLLAKQLGHTVVPPAPALVQLYVRENIAALQGLSLKNVSATVRCGSISHTKFGELLFTDKSLTGPIILSLSSLINREKPETCECCIDLKPALTQAELDKRLLSDFAKYKNKQLKNALFDLLPHALVPVVIQRAEIDDSVYVHDITRAQRECLVSVIKQLRFSLTALDSIERGIVTAGGVDVKEISPKTMESKLHRGLFFAGELLDVDAFTGGYNIQIALSTGYAAGRGAKEA